ncbi:MAG: MBL fold metallo-hydrolase [Burkholderiaceae bacterium]|nr:MBL fold metallo-hydrolase [Burkholderiaceae bacterium]
MQKTLGVLLLCSSLASAAENPDTLAERSQARARKVVDTAVTAIGGAEALRGIETLQLQLQGETWPRLQMPTPNPPFEPGSFQESLVLDLKDNRLYLEQRVGGAGFDAHNTVVIKSGEGTTYDHRARTATPIPGEQTSQQQFVQYYRRLPNLILRQALDGANSLRYLGEDQFNGRKHDVVTFVMPDTQQVALYVDARTGLISKYELVFTDPLRGQQASEIMFSDYATAGKLKVPQTWAWRFAGDIVAQYKVQAQFNSSDAVKVFETPHAGYSKVAAAPSTLKQSVEKLAEGVYVIHNVAAQNYNTMAVEFKDHIIAIEAPGSSDGADAVIKRIKETIPGKPIRYVVVTHHHGDHIGGLRSFIAEGATVITTQQNRQVVETMAKAPQKDTLARNPRKPQYLFIENGNRTMTDGEQTVELIDVGPNPHARELLIAYLPKQRVVFQGDLFFIPNNDAPVGPPQPSTLSFAQKLKEKGLVVERIASVHGRTATMAEFNAALLQKTALN